MMVILLHSICVGSGHSFSFWVSTSSAVNRNCGRLPVMMQVFESRVACEFSLLT